ncbi:hypothetical protein IAG25_40860 [Caballeronia sp. EK]|uniref:hypothetical protein n=1 Tax=Caballeronia sp. EK TaxID=2767469 RepID=UPI001655B26C|nr:hypothetical protein [Caballeronia sp. EK]MBC8643059.1 hypothetical protein [Caballeronia sp. EK]
MSFGFVDFKIGEIMTSVTNRTIARAVSGIENLEDWQSPNMILHGKNFGNKGWGVVKDIVLSMITFGIYAAVKSSRMDEKSADLEAGLRGLQKMIDNMGERQNDVQVVLKGNIPLRLEESASGEDLKIYLGTIECVTINGMTIKDFKKHLDREISFLDEAGMFVGPWSKKNFIVF